MVRAEQVYRADLKIHPYNGWALYGVARCLERKEMQKEADAYWKQYRESWARSDIKIKTSCFFATKKLN